MTAFCALYAADSTLTPEGCAHAVFELSAGVRTHPEVSMPTPAIQIVTVLRELAVIAADEP